MIRTGTIVELHPCQFVLQCRKRWRSIAILSVQGRLDAIGVHRHKVQQLGGLQSRAVGSQTGRMAPETLGKAPVSAIFRPNFVDSLRVFW
jgi:hypothetical protein